MKKITIKEIIDQFEKSCGVIYEATLSGDYRANNREGKTMISVFKVFEKDAELADSCLPILLKSKNIVIRTKAAAYCLSLQKNTETAVSILEEAMQNESNGIFGFNAKMTLKVWRETGFLRIYQKQNIR